jgi:hypothetical protein
MGRSRDVHRNLRAGFGGQLQQPDTIKDKPNQARLKRAAFLNIRRLGLRADLSLEQAI